MSSLGFNNDSLIDTSSENAQLDAFGRQRTSLPQSIFETTFRWDKQPVTWTELDVSGGTVTHSANKASVDLAVTTTTNSRAVFQSRQYIKYHPGKSHLILISGSFNSGATSVTKRFGYYDDDNGVFFQMSGTTLSVVRRTKTSGSVVDNTTNQSSWNLDKLDGAGASGYTLDTSKQQIMVIDFQWLGSGRIRYGFDLGGKIIYCHEEHTGNVLTVPWSQTGDAPIRAEILNAGSTASSMHITCCSAITESHYSPEGLIRTANNGVTPRSIAGSGTLPLLSLRKQTAYINAIVKMVDLGWFASSADDLLCSVVLNGTLTGASWVNAAGVCQVDRSATAISDGTTIYSTYLRGAAGAVSVSVTDIFRDVVNTALGRDISGNSDIISLVATNITSGTSVATYLNYRELV